MSSVLFILFPPVNQRSRSVTCGSYTHRQNMEKREDKISFTLKSHPPLVLAEKGKKRGGVTSMFARNTISRIMWDSTNINF